MEDSTQLEGILTDWFRAGLSEAGSLSDMERIARERLKEIGRRAFECWLREEERRYPTERVACECGGEAVYVRRRGGQLRTVLGVVNYVRAYYLCEHCHQGVYPLDKRLGLRPNAMSAELERLTGILGVERPFEQGSRLLQETLLIELSDHSLDKAAQAYGEEQMKREAEWDTQAQDMDGLLERQRTMKPPRRLYGCMDGGRVHVRGQPGSRMPLGVN